MYTCVHMYTSVHVHCTCTCMYYVRYNVYMYVISLSLSLWFNVHYSVLHVLYNICTRSNTVWYEILEVEVLDLSTEL